MVGPGSSGQSLDHTLRNHPWTELKMGGTYMHTNRQTSFSWPGATPSKIISSCLKPGPPCTLYTEPHPYAIYLFRHFCCKCCLTPFFFAPFFPKSGFSPKMPWLFVLFLQTRVFPQDAVSGDKNPAKSGFLLKNAFLGPFFWDLQMAIYISLI